MAHMAMSGTVPDVTGLNNNVVSNNNNNNINNNNPNVSLERRCDNPDCTVYKMVSNVPKRKTPQFVTDPVVMEKPLLINGFTTIFQIEGQSAKLSDIKNADPKRPLYRIVPNTHAHIVNYVVVDSDAESLRKIHENDPATMRKLLDSQKQSADQMLKKLIAGHDLSSIAVATSMAVSTSTPISTTSAMSNVGGINPVATSKLMVPTATTAIQLPPSVHPNLKITAVASAEGLSNLNIGNKMNATGTVGKNMNTTSAAMATQQTSQTNNMPLITPVPLANLQRAPPIPVAAITSHTNLMPTQSTSPMPTPVAASSGLSDPVDKSNFDKMQQELKELRRTVALLAEAQAKNKQN